MGLSPRLASIDWTKLVDPVELSIAHKLGDFPDVVEEAAKLREPHRIVFYVEELARDFQSYFTVKKNDPILPPTSVREKVGWETTWDMQKTHARLAWVQAIRTVYRGALDILGVTAVDRMERPAEAEAGEGEAD
jgi:arginyl-tRNA synthetase